MDYEGIQRMHNKSLEVLIREFGSRYAPEIIDLYNEYREIAHRITGEPAYYAPVLAFRRTKADLTTVFRP